MTDRGIPATCRYMHGFGSHIFSFINAKNERYWVKFHFRSHRASRTSPMRKPRLSSAITARAIGDFPKWTLKVQVIAETDAAKLPCHPFDLPKVWLHNDCPLIDVG
jgi:catalase